MGIIIGLLVGALAGIAGGFVGNIIFSLVGFGTTNIIGSIIVAVVGACIIIAVVNAIKSKK